MAFPTFIDLLEDAIPHQAGSETTQRPNTTNSYKKVAEYFKASLPKGAKVLDFGAGMGLGTQAMQAVFGPDIQVDSFEPSTGRSRAAITYTQSDQIPGDYDLIVCLNVLNVLEPTLRRAVTKYIFSCTKPEGFIVFGARKWKGDVDQAFSGDNAGDEPKSVWVKLSGGRKVYQKGFDGSDLQNFVSSFGGNGDTVTPIPRITATAVLVHKGSFKRNPATAKYPSAIAGVK